MVGAILGDIIGSPFEFDRGEKTKAFCLFTNGVEYSGLNYSSNPEIGNQGSGHGNHGNIIPRCS